jgi:hypothetical protein
MKENSEILAIFRHEAGKPITAIRCVANIVGSGISFNFLISSMSGGRVVRLFKM